MAQSLNEFVAAIDGERDLIVDFLITASDSWVNRAATIDDPSVRHEMRTAAATAQLLARWIDHGDHRR